MGRGREKEAGPNGCAGKIVVLMSSFVWACEILDCFLEDEDDAAAADVEEENEEEEKVTPIWLAANGSGAP